MASNDEPAHHDDISADSLKAVNSPSNPTKQSFLPVKALGGIELISLPCQQSFDEMNRKLPLAPEVVDNEPNQEKKKDPQYNPQCDS